MQNLFYDRLMQIMSYLEIDSLRGFSKRIGISFSKLQSYQRGSSPSIDVLNIILFKINEISPEWLLTGNEPMLKKTTLNLQPEDQETLRELYDKCFEELLTLRQKYIDKEKQVSDLIKMNLYLLEREKDENVDHENRSAAG